MMASYQQQNRTVLGVSIKGSAVDLAACNALNANIVNCCKTSPF